MPKKRNERFIVKTDKPRSHKFYRMRAMELVDDGPRLQSQTRSSGVTRKREAERIAAEWEDSLNNATPKPDTAISWHRFRDRAETEYFARKSPSYLATFRSACGKLEETIELNRLNQLTADALSIACSVWIEDDEMSPNTAETYFKHLRKGLNWAVEIGLIDKAPKTPSVDAVEHARGRPLTRDEYIKMLDAADLYEYPGLTWAIQVLWHSGLRLKEACHSLYWDSQTSLSIYELDTDRPKLWIPAGKTKGKRGEVIPIAPSFARLLWEVPADRRTGKVVEVLGQRGKALKYERIGEKIRDVGKRAGVETGVNHRNETMFASAQDLRRSYGFRMAALGIPVNTLRVMMRHRNISTTQNYYLTSDADVNADLIWKMEG